MFLKRIKKIEETVWMQGNITGKANLPFFPLTRRDIFTDIAAYASFTF